MTATGIDWLAMRMWIPNQSKKAMALVFFSEMMALVTRHRPGAVESPRWRGPYVQTAWGIQAGALQFRHQTREQTGQEAVTLDSENTGEFSVVFMDIFWLFIYIFNIKVLKHFLKITKTSRKKLHNTLMACIQMSRPKPHEFVHGAFQSWLNLGHVIHGAGTKLVPDQNEHSSRCG